MRECSFTKWSIILYVEYWVGIPLNEYDQGRETGEVGLQGEKTRSTIVLPIIILCTLAFPLVKYPSRSFNGVVYNFLLSKRLETKSIRA
jgi:hypothetical protein